jgi:hypothetical protein
MLGKNTLEGMVMVAMIGVDIDGTIAGRNLQRFKEVCNQEFHLGMTPERLESLDYWQFIGAQEVQQYQEQVGKEVFAEATYQISQDPAMLAILPTLPNAVEGLRYLLNFGHISYYSVRKHSDPEKAKQLHKVTEEWLAFHKFPNPDNVIICQSALAKLVRMHEREADNQNPLILIDDMASMIVNDFPIIESKDSRLAQSLRQRMTLVLFGSNTLPSTNPNLQVTCLPAWSYIKSLDWLFSLV